MQRRKTMDLYGDKDQRAINQNGEGNNQKNLIEIRFTTKGTQRTGQHYKTI